MLHKNVQLLVDNHGSRRVVSMDNGQIIARTIIEALHLPIATAIQTIVISTVRTAYETYGEIVLLHQSSKVDRKIRVRYSTAEQVNSSILKMENDSFTDEVKQLLRTSLMEILRDELSRPVR